MSDRTALSVTLPSKGIPYGTKIPNGIVEIYPMRAKEQKLLSGFTGSRRNEALNMLLKSCLKTQIDPKELTTSDRFFVLMWLRIVSVGEIYNVDLTCPSCNARFTEDINLNNFEIRELKEDFREPFEVELPESNDVVTLRLMRGEDESAIQRYVDRSNPKNELGDSSFIYRLCRQLSTVNGKELGERDKIEYIENLLIKDAQILEDSLTDNDSGMVPKIEADCPRCDYHIETTLPLGPTFFRPKK